MVEQRLLDSKRKEIELLQLLYQDQVSFFLRLISIIRQLKSMTRCRRRDSSGHFFEPLLPRNFAGYSRT